MKKFAIKLLGIALILLAVATTMQVAISIRIKDKNSNNHDTFFVIKNQKNHLVFLGSSRCAEHFIPAVFKNTLGVATANLGVYAHPDLPITIMRLRYYLKYNPPPKYAILNWDISCRNGPLNFEENTDEGMKNCFSRYAFFTQQDNDMIVKYFHFNIAEQFIPLYAILKYKSIFECITLAGGKPWLQNGYIIEDEQIKLDSTTMLAARLKLSESYDKFSVHYDSIKQQMQYLNSYCYENNIKLICLQSPFYGGAYDKKLYDLPQKVCADLNITYIDGNIPEIANDSANFSNVSHLNSTGARKLCNYLCTDKTFLGAIGHARGN